MATTNIKKNSQGYGYQYTDLAEIHNYLEANNMSYYQYIEPVDGVDYIMTVPIIDGKEMPPRRGCRLLDITQAGGGKNSNIFQQEGSMLTYFRRYSALLAFGLATTDDDAACLTRNPEDIEAKTINKAAAKNLHDLVMSHGFTDDWLFNKYHVSKYSEITEKQFAEVVKNIHLWEAL